jgi:hypothetical protein
MRRKPPPRLSCRGGGGARGELRGVSHPSAPRITGPHAPRQQPHGKRGHACCGGARLQRPVARTRPRWCRHWVWGHPCCG